MADQRSAISRQRREDFPSPSGTFEWRDICERCSDVIEMPLDGTPPKHLCLTDPIPWDELMKRDPGISSLLVAIRHCRLERGVVPSVTVQEALGFVDPEGPFQMGPFAPGQPPRPVTIGDLLLYSRTDLCSLLNAAGAETHASVAVVEKWLAEYRLTLAPRNGLVLQDHVHAEYSARYKLLSPAERSFLFCNSPKDLQGKDVARILYALSLLERVRARSAKEME